MTVSALRVRLDLPAYVLWRSRALAPATATIGTSSGAFRVVVVVIVVVVVVIVVLARHLQRRRNVRQPQFGSRDNDR
jgi:hypothetical protein